MATHRNRAFEVPDIWEEAKKIFRKKIQDVNSNSFSESKKSLESAIDDLKEPSDMKVNAADLLISNQDKQETLACAASHKEFDIMSYLQDQREKRGANLDFLRQLDRRVSTPLQYCVKFDEHAAAKRLLQLGKRNPGPGNDGKSTSTLAKAMCKVSTRKDGHYPLRTAAF